MNEGVLTIKSIANLAYFLSTTRENLSRLLHEMEESGKIAIHKNYIEVIKK
jgi:CRP-like cAMP-binding protein